MTKDEVWDWALEHGFTEQQDARLTADYSGTVVAIEFTKRNVRVTQSRDGQTLPIASAHPGNAHVNEHGVMEGLGLSASFVATLYGEPDAVPPPWMPQAYLDAIGWTGLPAEEQGAAPSP